MDLRNRIASISLLAKTIGFKYTTVHSALSGKTQAGPKLAIAIEKGTCGCITRSDLRPDLWPPKKQAPPRKSA